MECNSAICWIDGIISYFTFVPEIIFNTLWQKERRFFTTTETCCTAPCCTWIFHRKCAFQSKTLLIAEIQVNCLLNLVEKKAWMPCEVNALRIWLKSWRGTKLETNYFPKYQWMKEESSLCQAFSGTDLSRVVPHSKMILLMHTTDIDAFSTISWNVTFQLRHFHHS